MVDNPQSTRPYSEQHAIGARLTPHAAGIAKVLVDYPDAQTRGFMRACNAIIQPIAGECSGQRIIPDAFIIDQEQEVVVAFEVEDTYPVSVQKLDRYRWLWWELNYADWGLLLIIVSRWQSYAASIDMGDMAIGAAMRHC